MSGYITQHEQLFTDINIKIDDWYENNFEFPTAPQPPICSDSVIEFERGNLESTLSQNNFLENLRKSGGLSLTKTSSSPGLSNSQSLIPLFPSSPIIICSNLSSTEEKTGLNSSENNNNSLKRRVSSQIQDEDRNERHRTVKVPKRYASAEIFSKKL